MEDILISAARTIINQANRIEEMELYVNELNRRLERLENEQYIHNDRFAYVESRINNDNQNTQIFINDLYEAVCRFNSHSGN